MLRRMYNKFEPVKGARQPRYILNIKQIGFCAYKQLKGKILRQNKEMKRFLNLGVKVFKERGRVRVGQGEQLKDSDHRSQTIIGKGNLLDISEIILEVLFCKRNILPHSNMSIKTWSFQGRSAATKTGLRYKCCILEKK